LKIIWNPEFFKVLGIWFGHDLDRSIDKNYREKFEEVKSLFQVWMQRNITPLGRIAVLKSLILSKLIHLFILLPNPPDHHVANLQKDCFNFVWKGKPDRIRRQTAVKNVRDGGLSIPDIKTYIICLKLMWIRKLKFGTHKWKNVCLAMFPFVRNIECFGSQYPLLNANANLFWTHVFKAYDHFSQYIPHKTNIDVLSEPVFYNDKMRVGGTVIRYKKWIIKGVYFIAHFCNENGNFYDVTTFNRMYGLSVDYLTHRSTVSAIRQYLTKINVTLENNNYMELPLNLKYIYRVQKGCKNYYDLLINKNKKPNCCLKWEGKLNSSFTWKCIFIKIQKIQEIKLKWLQIRITHRILATNILLTEMNVKSSSMCTFCKVERDSIEHIFWQCEISRSFWTSIETLLTEKCAHVFNLHLSQSLILFGVDERVETDIVLDLIILVGKSFIYTCKTNNKIPTIPDFIKYLHCRYKIDEYNAKISLQLQTFRANWVLYQAIFDSIC